MASGSAGVELGLAIAAAVAAAAGSELMLAAVGQTKTDLVATGFARLVSAFASGLTTVAAVAAAAVAPGWIFAEA